MRSHTRMELSAEEEKSCRRSASGWKRTANVRRSQVQKGGGDVLFSSETDIIHSLAQPHPHPIPSPTLKGSPHRNQSLHTLTITESCPLSKPQPAPQPPIPTPARTPTLTSFQTLTPSRTTLIPSAQRFVRKHLGTPPSRVWNTR